MNDNLKKILLIIALIGASALIGFGLYKMFKKTTTPTSQKQTTEQQTGQLPSSQERSAEEESAAPAASGLTRGEETTGASAVPQVQPSYYKLKTINKVTSENTVSPSLSQSGSMRFYNASDGRFYRLGDDGKLKELADKTFYNVEKVTWAKTTDKAVLEYPDGSKTIYDFEESKQVTLPKHWEEFSFSPDGSQVAAKSMGLSPENRWLVTVNDDGSGVTLVEPMGENADKVTIDWSPSKQTVAFSQTGEPLGANRREVLFVGLNGENFKSAVVEGLGFEPQWSPTGEKLLYSVYSARSEFKPELWITDAYGENIGSNRQMLKINTWAEKCAFANETTLYCAVPRSLPAGAGMSPESFSSYDDMYKIDTKTGLKTNIALGDDYTINNITFDKTKNKLYFTDSNQSGIFEIKI